MKKVKRKYTRHDKIEPKPNNVQSNSTPLKEEVKKILESNTMSWYRDDKVAWIDITTKAICHLFPKSESNPDGCKIYKSTICKDCEREEWQVAFTSKLAAKYERRVAEIQEHEQAKVRRVFLEITQYFDKQDFKPEVYLWLISLREREGIE